MKLIPVSAKPAQNFLLFLSGGTLFAAGVFLFTNQVMVSSGLMGFGWAGRGVGRAIEVGPHCSAASCHSGWARALAC